MMSVRQARTATSLWSVVVQKGRGGMGSRKHGISGRAGKGPVTRLWLDMMARKNERKSRSRKLQFTSVTEAIQKDRRGR
jgi:hypothetical protein